MVKIQGTFLITMAKIQGRCNNSTLLQGKIRGRQPCTATSPFLILFIKPYGLCTFLNRSLASVSRNEVPFG